MTLASGASAPFTVNPGSADHLVFVQQPSTTQRTLTITPSITVRILDAFGNNVSTSASVTLAIGIEPRQRDPVRHRDAQCRERPGHVQRPVNQQHRAGLHP